MIKKRLFVFCTCLVLATPALAQQSPPQGMTTDQINRVLQNVIAQREQAMNSAAVCQGDETFLQQQHAADQAKIDELTKQIAAQKPPAPSTPVTQGE